MEATGLRRRRCNGSGLMQEEDLADDRQEEMEWLEAALASMTAAKRSELGVEASSPDEAKTVKCEDPVASKKFDIGRKERRPLADKTNSIQNSAQRGGNAQPKGTPTKPAPCAPLPTRSHSEESTRPSSTETLSLHALEVTDRCL